jgi:hypothetical protein
MSDSATSIHRQDVLGAVYRAIDAVNGLRPADQQLPKTPDLVLMGAGSTLDSLAFTTLILAIERNVEDLTGTSLDLLGSSAVESGLAALQRIDSLVELILRQLAE